MSQVPYRLRYVASSSIRRHFWHQMPSGKVPWKRGIYQRRITLTECQCAGIQIATLPAPLATSSSNIMPHWQIFINFHPQKVHRNVYMIRNFSTGSRRVLSRSKERIHYFPTHYLSYLTSDLTSYDLLSYS